jgi:deazaflavin-dependent oxidoreductase (nitroreductase family)
MRTGEFAMTIKTPPGGTYGARMPRGRLLRFGSRMMSAMYRRFGGRGSADLLLLTTVGARSGEQRTTAVRRFEEGDGRWLIVGSAGGRATHPAWLHNLAAHPDKVWVEIGHDKWKVRPELIDGDARDQDWKRIVAEAPQFGKYETTTDREIPVVRLTRDG